MSQSFEKAPDQALSIANPFAAITAPFREEPLPPVHPYPGWKPTARGDSNALLPWIDDDLREQSSNPVATGISIVDKAHLAADAAMNGGTLVSKLSHEASELISGEASAGKLAFAGASAVAAPLAIAGGILEIDEGLDQWKHGNRADGGFAMTGGGLNILSGGSGLAALGGSSALAATSAGSASLALGLAAGHHGDKQVKKLGWLHDDDGRAVSASEWAGHLGRGADDYLTDRGHPYLGTAAGIATTFGASVVGAGMAMDAELISAGKAAGSKLANQHRASHYANYEGATVTGGAQALADYDDDQEAAVERSKVEHPERWGHNPNNPTFGQAYSGLLGQVNAITGGTKR
jgi:hypothetical protein